MFKDHGLKLTYVIFGLVPLNIFSYDSDKVVDDEKYNGDLIYQLLESMFRIDWLAFPTVKLTVNRGNLGPQSHCTNLK